MIIVYIGIIVIVLVGIYKIKIGYSVERSRTIHAPAETVFAIIRDLKTWSKLNSWFIHEPEANMTYSDNYKEVGGSYSWSGKLIGSGTLEHTEIIPDTYITQKLTFIKPMKAICECFWEVDAHDNSCTVKWKMKGKIPLFLCFIIPYMRRMLEKDFTFGLNMLAMHVDPEEEQYHFHFKGIHETPHCHYVYKDFNGPISQVQEFARHAFPELTAQLEKDSIKITGNPFALTWNITKDTIHYAVALPVEKNTSSTLKIHELYSTKAIKLMLHGSYAHIPEAFACMMEQAKMLRSEVALSPKSPALEIYETMIPDKEQESVTALYLPVK